MREGIGNILELEIRGQACRSGVRPAILAILLDRKRRLDFLAFISRKEQSHVMPKSLDIDD